MTGIVVERRMTMFEEVKKILDHYAMAFEVESRYDPTPYAREICQLFEPKPDQTKEGTNAIDYLEGVQDGYKKALGEGKKIVAEPDASRLLTERELTDVMKECWMNTIPLGETDLEKYANLSKVLAFEVAQAQLKKAEPLIRQDEREKMVGEIEGKLGWEDDDNGNHYRTIGAVKWQKLKLKWGIEPKGNPIGFVNEH